MQKKLITEQEIFGCLTRLRDDRLLQEYLPKALALKAAYKAQKQAASQ